MRDTLKLGDNGALVRTLQTMLNTVGANITVDGIFGDATFEMVCDFQSWKILEPDGVVGPLTWDALDDATRKHERHVKQLDSDKLEVAGRRAIERALAYWRTDIYDPPRADYTVDGRRSKQVIDTMIRGRNALDWTWETEYRGDGDFQWCGAFAAACWPDVKQSLRQTYFASTPRLDRYASYRSFQGEPNTGSGRVYLELDEHSQVADVVDIVRPGDILMIGPSRTDDNHATWRACGQHICLVESFGGGAGVFHTIEGNGNGTGPNGERQQGVVKGVRNLGGHGWHARRLIRPSVEDLV
jgi:hypothetical protein